MRSPINSLHRTTQTIVIGSENPVKLEAARRAFSRVFSEVELQTETCKVASGVASQPQGERGAELGDAIDSFFGTEGAKRKEGAIGLLTRGTLCRTDLYEQGIIAALIPFL